MLEREDAPVRSQNREPGTDEGPGFKVGVGVRHALFPFGTAFGTLAFAGCVLPDATQRGMR